MNVNRVLKFRLFGIALVCLLSSYSFADEIGAITCGSSSANITHKLFDDFSVKNTIHCPDCVLSNPIKYSVWSIDFNGQSQASIVLMGELCSNPLSHVTGNCGDKLIVKLLVDDETSRMTRSFSKKDGTVIKEEDVSNICSGRFLL